MKLISKSFDNVGSRNYDLIHADFFIAQTSRISSLVEGLRHFLSMRSFKVLVQPHAIGSCLRDPAKDKHASPYPMLWNVGNCWRNFCSGILTPSCYVSWRSVLLFQFYEDNTHLRLKTTFYITDSSAFRNQLLYFRHDDWKDLCEPLVRRLTQGTFVKMPEVRVNFCGVIAADNVHDSLKLRRFCGNASWDFHLFAFYRKKRGYGQLSI